ncbi:hypothetical protein ACWCPF_32480 [Streptomyces sp. NPDC001858]
MRQSGVVQPFQQVLPVERNYVYQDLVIASVSTRFLFFGERCAISSPIGEPASSSCVGFGVERWLHVVADHFGGDWDRARDAVEEAGKSLG